jgi:hypothetical protein
LLSVKFAAKATIAALALAGSLAAVAPAAQAQRIDPPGPGGTSLDYACYGIQTDYVDGVAEFKAAYAAVTPAPKPGSDGNPHPGANTLAR